MLTIPTNKAQRLGQLVLAYLGGIALVTGVLQDYGPGKNAMRPAQRFVMGKIDKFFDISDEELSSRVSAVKLAQAQQSASE